MSDDLKTKIIDVIEEYYCDIGTGGSGGTGRPGPISRRHAAKYYLHVQKTLDSIWKIAHNFNQQYVQVQVINSNNYVVQPKEIRFINKNVVWIYFGVETVGYATIMAGPSISELILDEDEYLYKFTGGTGSIGLRGPTGGTGCRGERGPMGLQGPPGLMGSTGRHGRDGRDGCPGPPGPEGPQGEQGPPGPKGCDGKDGRCYDTGGTGAAGKMGPPGSTGGTGGDGGRTGGTGGTGAVGKMGPPGPTGSTGGDGGRSGGTGGTGGTGGIGPEGPEGPPGPKGPEGPEGPAGPPTQDMIDLIDQYNELIKKVNALENIVKCNENHIKQLQYDRIVLMYFIKSLLTGTRIITPITDLTDELICSLDRMEFFIGGTLNNNCLKCD